MKFCIYIYIYMFLWYVLCRLYIGRIGGPTRAGYVLFMSTVSKIMFMIVVKRAGGRGRHNFIIDII